MALNVFDSCLQIILIITIPFVVTFRPYFVDKSVFSQCFCRRPFESSYRIPAPLVCAFDDNMHMVTAYRYRINFLTDLLSFFKDCIFDGFTKVFWNNYLIVL